ncbi:hypothetical protein M422DRAFT_773740 [Sphaerobolus stellatus SS14]|nr:hypothetical protein M422DRAFT_773740 [Sphaerobolus stellatus SS14]
MFSKVLVISGLVASFAMQGYAHAAIAPELGVSGNPVRGNVLRANNNCGGANLAAIDTSTTIPITNGVVSGLTITNFNAGADGSRSIKAASLNSDGTGKAFAAVTVTKNGNANPTNVGSEPLTIKLPAGAACDGGKNKNRCLLSLTTTAGFGNCVVLTSGAAAAAKPAAAATNNAAAATTKTKDGKKSKKGKKGKKGAKKQRRSWIDIVANDHH